MYNQDPLMKVPMVQKKFAVTLLVAALSLVLLDCAGQAPPGGGPVDAVPPRVVRTFPDTNAVHVATGKITLEFSKYVDRQSVEQAIRTRRSCSRV